MSRTALAGASVDTAIFLLLIEDMILTNTKSIRLGIFFVLIGETDIKSQCNVIYWCLLPSQFLMILLI